MLAFICIIGSVLFVVACLLAALALRDMSEKLNQLDERISNLEDLNRLLLEFVDKKQFDVWCEERAKKHQRESEEKAIILPFVRKGQPDLS